MLSLETYPAFYLGYISAYSSTNSSSNLGSPYPFAAGKPGAVTASCSRRPEVESYYYDPYYECHACGVPLRIFRKCFSIPIAEDAEEGHEGDSAMSAHLCITTYRSPNNEVLKLELCFVGQDCQRIPSILGATYGLQTKRLDLSYNAIRSLEGLEKFPHLEELILDNNFIDDSVTLPRLETLNTLSLNKNKVANLEKFLDQVSEKLPQLRYLSLLGNEACPNQLSSLEKDEKDYKRYRLYVLHRLNGLRFLDSTAVRRTELREARKRGGLMKMVKPTNNNPVQNSNTEVENHKETAKETTMPNETTDISDNKGQEQNGTACKRETSSPEHAQNHRGAYGVRRYRYVGQHSEGNRFISNEHL